MRASPIVYDYRDVQLDAEASQQAHNRAQATFQQAMGTTSPKLVALQAQSFPQSQKQGQPVRGPSAQNNEQLAAVMADLLIQESQRQSKLSKGKRKTPFLKEALPGENQKYHSSKYFLGFCQFVAIFFACLHTFVYASVYDMWGEGKIGMIVISVIQLSCAAYTFMLAFASDTQQIKSIYNQHIYIYAIAAVVCLPTLLISFLAYIAYQQADHIASYTVTRNSLQFSAATLLPFLVLLLVLVILINHRSFEIDAKDIAFDPNYHQHPLQAARKEQSPAQQANESRDLTIKLLKSYLEEPSQRAPQPDLEKHQPAQLIQFI